MAVNNDALRSDEILASMVTVSRTIPRKVTHVVGPSTFSVLMGHQFYCRETTSLMTYVRACWAVVVLSSGWRRQVD